MTTNDDFDMFSPTPVVPLDFHLPLKPLPVPSEDSSRKTLRAEDHADVEGYFHAPVGALVEQYVVGGELGRGVFSTVFAVTDLNTKEELAIKVSRANEIVRKAGEKELEILKAIGPHPYVVRLVDSFDLAAEMAKTAHLVLVFERMSMNLRETLDKFGKNVGISLLGVRVFARQLFSCLARLKELGIVHADLKPDNILVSADLRRCAIGDFGSAFRLTDPEANQPTPYLISRYYRSPEVMLGLEYGCEVDMWSVGVTLFELFAGVVLFTGGTNNDMLRLFQKALGRFPNHIVKRHIAAYESKLELEPHFELQELKFKHHDVHPVTKAVVRTLVRFPEHPKGTDSLRGMIVRKAEADGTPVDQTLIDFAEFLEKCLTLDPAQRLDPRQAESCKFFQDTAAKIPIAEKAALPPVKVDPVKRPMPAALKLFPPSQVKRQNVG